MSNGHENGQLQMDNPKWTGQMDTSDKLLFIRGVHLQLSICSCPFSCPFAAVHFHVHSVCVGKKVWEDDKPDSVIGQSFF